MCKELLTETINVCGFMYLTILLDKITNLFKSKLAALEQCRNVLRTQCKDEFRNLSGCVTEILTASRINIIFFEKYH